METKTALIPMDGVSESVLPVVGSELQKLETYLKTKVKEVNTLDPEDAKKAAEKRLEMKRERLKSEKYIDEQVEKVMKEKAVWDNQERGWKHLKKGMKLAFAELENKCEVIEKAEEERRRAELLHRTNERMLIVQKYGQTMTITDLQTISDQVWPAVEADMKRRFEEEQELRRTNEEAARLAALRQAELRKLHQERMVVLSPLSSYIKQDIDWAHLGELSEEDYSMILSVAQEAKQEDDRARMAEQERMRAERQRIEEEKKKAEEEIRERQRIIKIAQDRVNMLFTNFQKSYDINVVMNLTEEEFNALYEKNKLEKAEEERVRAEQEKQRMERERKEAEQRRIKAEQEAAERKQKEEENRVAKLPARQRLEEFAYLVSKIPVPECNVEGAGAAFEAVKEAHKRYVSYILKTADTIA